MIKLASLLIQAPMPYDSVLVGALETLKRCRPFLMMSPITRDEALTACKTAQPAEYDFWAEPAVPGGDTNTLLIVGVPSERKVRIDGFYKIEV